MLRCLRERDIYLHDDQQPYFPDNLFNNAGLVKIIIFRVHINSRGRSRVFDHKRPIKQSDDRSDKQPANGRTEANKPIINRSIKQLTDTNNTPSMCLHVSVAAAAKETCS